MKISSRLLKFVYQLVSRVMAQTAAAASGSLKLAVAAKLKGFIYLRPEEERCVYPLRLAARWIAVSVQLENRVLIGTSVQLK